MSQSKSHIDNKGGKPFGYAERQVAFRYLRAKKSHGGVGLITFISFACIALAIAAMIIIMSIMNGFRDEMIKHTIGSQGHIYVSAASANPSNDEIKSLEKRVTSIEGVEKAFQYTQNFAGVQANGTIAAGQIIGIRSRDIQSFPMIVNNIIDGSLQDFGQGYGAEQQVAIGYQLANQLGVRAGDQLVIYSGKTRSSAVGGERPIFKPYTVGAVFRIGIYESDLTYIYMHLDETSLLFNGGRPSPDIMLRLYDADEIDAKIKPIRTNAGQPIFLQTWRDKNEGTAIALRTEQVVMRLIFGIVVIIAMFPVLAAMIMLVKNKSKDIAILRTMGATSQSILRIFLIAGSMIGILGTFLGVIGGVLFCLNISAVQAFIEFVTGRELFPPEVYQLEGGIPAKLVWAEVAAISFWGFIVAALATFFPAWTASKVDPVEALRYE